MRNSVLQCYGEICARALSGDDLTPARQQVRNDLLDMLEVCSFNDIQSYVSSVLKTQSHSFSEGTYEGRSKSSGIVLIS